MQPGQLKNANTKKEGLHADGGGLYLQVTPDAAAKRAKKAGKAGGDVTRSWVFMYQRGKKTTTVGLGPVHTVGLAEAREKAREYRKLLLDGGDPLQHKRAEKARKAAEAGKQILTFDDAVRRYLKDHMTTWTPGQYDQWAASMRDHVSPKIGKLAVDAITTQHLLAVLEPIWRIVPVTASRVRGRIERVLGACTVRGERVGDNPAAWKGNLQEALPATRAVRAVKRMPALAYAELPAFMAQLRVMDGVPALALQLAVLTAVRSHDIRNAKRSDIDLDSKVWTIAEFSKTGKPHRVPLSSAAIDVIARAIAHADAIGGEIAASGLVFPNDVTGQMLSVNAMAAVLKRLGMKGRMTTHGCRASFRTWGGRKPCSRASFAKWRWGTRSAPKSSAPIRGATA
jgi:integrase